MSLASVLRNCLLACLLLGGLSAHAQPGDSTPTYSFALIPIIPPAEIKRRWQPVLDQLARTTGLRFYLRFYTDVADFEQGLMHDEVDFVLLGPVQAWQLRSHYRPLLRNSLPLTGLVMVHKTSPLQQLSDLQGRRLALQQGENLSANFFVRQALREQKIEPVLKIERSEGNALRSVVLGKADAAIIANYILKLLPPEIVAQTRAIYRTQELPPPAFAANVHLSAEDIQRVKTALLRLRATHSPLLNAILMPEIMEADLDRDYSSIGKLVTGEAANGHP